MGICPRVCDIILELIRSSKDSDTTHQQFGQTLFHIDTLGSCRSKKPGGKGKVRKISISAVIKQQALLSLRRDSKYDYGVLFSCQNEFEMRSVLQWAMKGTKKPWQREGDLISMWKAMIYSQFAWLRSVWYEAWVISSAMMVLLAISECKRWFSWLYLEFSIIQDDKWKFRRFGT